VKKIVNKLCPRGGPGRLSAEELAGLPDRLMDAALGLFNAQGYSDTTMEQIARQAGASTKTLYSRYANKAELVKAVVSRIVERSIAAHVAQIALDPRDTDPRVFLMGSGRKMAATINGEAAGMVRIALVEAWRFSELREMYAESVTRGRSIYREALETWHAQGLLPELGDAGRAAFLFVCMVSDQIRIRIAMGHPMTNAELDSHVPYAVDMFLRACGYTPKNSS
jgi:TetR/AcrR family transcriptional regulator, mexJK operon transcriptional repressor